MRKLKITILGCGNSTGVPAIGNRWGQCDPAEPKNLRTRSSLAVQGDTSTLIIDTGPDFRTQINRENIEKIDAILYTHAHGDHVNGIDELQIISYRNNDLVPIFGNREALDDLNRRFYYLFEGGDQPIYPAVAKPTEIKDFSAIHSVAADIEFTAFEQNHGACTSLGYRFGDLGYSVDMLDLNQDAVARLRGVKTWIVDAAGYKDNNNPVHASVEKIFQLNKEIGARLVVLTSLTLAMDYQTLRKELPEGFMPAYDGMVLEALF